MHIWQTIKLIAQLVGNITAFITMLIAGSIGGILVGLGLAVTTVFGA